MSEISQRSTLTFPFPIIRLTPNGKRRAVAPARRAMVVANLSRTLIVKGLPDCTIDEGPCEVATGVNDVREQIDLDCSPTLPLHCLHLFFLRPTGVGDLDDFGQGDAIVRVLWVIIRVVGGVVRDGIGAGCMVGGGDARC